MTQFGQYPAPTHVIAHLSDTHFLGADEHATGREDECSDGALLYGVIDTHRNLRRALQQLERSGANPAALVFTGDLTDLGEQDAYVSLRQIVEPVAARMGSAVIWVMGNHDERQRFAIDLYDDDPATGLAMRPQDRVHDIDGLRIIALDSTVPGYHHGDITPQQLEWLGRQLATPARHGTLLALHHPPIPTAIDLMALLELRGQSQLAEVIRGTDVRGILAGHLHYATHSTFAGIPVSVAAATCYTMDLSAPLHSLSGVDGGQSFDLVHIYDDQVVHSVIPIGDHAAVSGFSAGFVQRMAALSPEDRLDIFSNKTSTVTVADVEAGRA
ncbi:metallophosphoesterase [Frigoribacterium sp. CG_9.8]|uniref:metallophosphoesterase n=1 Tax=Frigoribacterium sp. CG_9.8 TaxID=2787733 RepID=UPI0018CBA349|nr:3',5'-cyclic AMP phosphodiesterase CpdA [Frigoribacterium sp. CG_9.8]